MKMLDKTEQSDRASNPPNEKPESCYCSALPKGSGLCPAIRDGWPAGARNNGVLSRIDCERPYKEKPAPGAGLKVDGVRHLKAPVSPFTLIPQRCIRFQWRGEVARVLAATIGFGDCRMMWRRAWR
jgi:hypothetical protein